MRTLAPIAVALFAVPSLALAHAGGLDANGCHQNKAKNVYECHQGPLKDQSFKSKSEAQTKLGSAGRPAEQTAKVPQPKQPPSKSAPAPSTAR